MVIAACSGRECQHGGAGGAGDIAERVLPIVPGLAPHDAEWVNIQREPALTSLPTAGGGSGRSTAFSQPAQNEGSIFWTDLKPSLASTMASRIRRASFDVSNATKAWISSTSRKAAATNRL